MSREDQERRGDSDGPSLRVVAAAIRDAIDAMKHERPDLAERLRVLLADIEAEAAPSHQVGQGAQGL